MKGSRRALTLVEVLVAASMLIVLLVAVFSVYIVGAGAWRKGDTQTELLQNLNLVLTRMTREIEGASLESLTLGGSGDAVCFLSAQRDDHGYDTEPLDGSLRWQKYVIYYHEGAGQAVLRREVPLMADAPERRSPGPIASYDPGGGPQPLDAYLTEGTVVRDHITKLTVALPPSSKRRVTIALEAEKKRYGSGAPERLALTTAARVRN